LEEAMVDDMKITVTDKPDIEDNAFIRDQLTRFNLLHAPEDQLMPLAVMMVDAKGALTGGLIGVTYWGWLHIETLWLRENVRGQGYGRKLLKAAEEEALRRGCLHVHVDTLDFQSPDFYKREGYTVWGVLDDLPPGHQRIFLKKDL
jgi:GNAT superfamily N-acetyltransferase